MSYLANTTGDPNNLGYFATPEALEAAYPVGFPGAFAIVGSTDTIWVWDEGTMMWVDTGGGSGGVMSISSGVGILATPNPIINTGSIALIAALQPLATLTAKSLKFLRVNVGETAVEYVTLPLSDLTVGTSVINSGNTTRVLYDNGGILGEYQITGTGKVVMDTSPTLSNPVVGTQTPGDSSTKAASTAFVVDAIATAVIGLLDYRGSYNASTNLFPATGGSGVAGAILKGDFWICSVSGTLGGVSVTPGDLIIATVDTPGQTAANWDLIAHDLGSYVTSITGTANQVIASASTGAVTLSLPQNIGTSSNPQFATIELGAASDTTISRVSAGVLAVEGIPIVAAGSTTVGQVPTITSSNTYSWQTPSSGGYFKGAYVYNSAAQTISDSTNTLLTFDSESFDDDSFHSTSVNTSRFTIPAGKGGNYIVTGSISFDPNGTGSRTARFLVNGSTVIAYQSIIGSGSSDGSLSLSAVYKFTAGDYVEIRVRQASGGNLNTIGGIGGCIFTLNALF